MAEFAFLIELKAKPGKEAEVEAFLEKEASLVKDEPGTLTWHGSKVEGEPGLYRVFDSFVDEAAGEAHMAGPAGQEFVDGQTTCSSRPRSFACRWSHTSKAARWVLVAITDMILGGLVKRRCQPPIFQPTLPQGTFSG